MTILIASIIHDLPTVVSQLHRLTLIALRVAPRVGAAGPLRRVLNWNDCRIYRVNLTSPVTVLRFCAATVN